MQVYISCPALNGDHKVVEQRLKTAADRLIDDGHQPISPSALRGDRSVTLPSAVRDVVNSDGAIFLNGWKDDDTCQVAHFTAVRLGKIVMYEHEIFRVRETDRE